MFRKIYYYLQIIPLISGVENWYDIIKIYFFPARPVVLKLKNGEVFKIGHYLDALTIKEIFIDQDYNVKLKNPKVILDIGGNIGTFSIPFAKKFPKARVFSFEPSPKTFDFLSFNIKENNVKNITALNIGIWSKKQKTVFYKNKASGLSSVFVKAKREGSTREKVSLETLSNVFDRNKIKSCDLLKIDCEGAEYEIILKMSIKILKIVKNFVIEYHDSLTSHKHIELVNYLKKNGFKTKVKPHPWETDIGIIYANQ